MKPLVNLTIDDQKIEAPEGTLIVDAAKKYGIDIPVFCYHPKMEPVGMCRMCLVEIGRPMKDRSTGEWVREADGSMKIQFGPKLETACTTPVSEGMVVRGLTDAVKAARKDVLEFLLTSHPLDCPICDKGGECPLQNLTMRHGPGQSRFLFDEKNHLAKHVPLGELIMLDRERCIQCARCVRFQDEIVDEPVIGFFQRGRALEIVTFSEPGFDSYFSGNTTDICPVGALTTVDFRFEARPWEMNAAASICTHCPVGCNLTVNVRREARAGGETVIKRVMPRQNEKVNEIWICDKGRFAYHFAQSKERLSQPLVRKAGELVPASWDEALETAAAGFRNAGKGFLALAGGRLANEDLYNLERLSSALGGKAVLHSTMAGGDLMAKVGVAQGTDFASMGPETVILVVACDLQEEAPLWRLRVKRAADKGANLIVVNPRPTRLDRHAARILRYAYGAEAATILAMINALSAKRLDLGDTSQADKSTIEEIARTVARAENAVIIYGSEGTGPAASQALAQACANLLAVTNHTGRPNNGLMAVWTAGNTQGAWDMGLRPLGDQRSLGEQRTLINDHDAFRSAKAIYAVAADPLGDDPSLAEELKSVGFLVVQELFLTETARMAEVVFPAMSFAEREGTYTNGARRVQRFYPAIHPLASGQADYAIVAQIGRRLGFDLEGRSAGLVMERIAAQIPDYKEINYTRLAEASEQWPIVGRQDLYYGGSTYENSQGLGIELVPAAQRGEPIPMSWIAPPEVKTAESELLAVPVTRLFDRGQTVLPSQLLHVRLPKPGVTLNPQDAGRLGIREGDNLQVQIKGTAAGSSVVYAAAHLDESAPPGIVLTPRSMGLPITGPQTVELKVCEPQAAADPGGS
jgi:NADH-quinone oxidoreductase subunit G